MRVILKSPKWDYTHDSRGPFTEQKNWVSTRQENLWPQSRKKTRVWTSLINLRSACIIVSLIEWAVPQSHLKNRFGPPTGVVQTSCLLFVQPRYVIRRLNGSKYAVTHHLFHGSVYPIFLSCKCAFRSCQSVRTSSYYYCCQSLCTTGNVTDWRMKLFSSHHRSFIRNKL